MNKIEEIIVKRVKEKEYDVLEKVSGIARETAEQHIKMVVSYGANMRFRVMYGEITLAIAADQMTSNLLVEFKITGTSDVIKGGCDSFPGCEEYKNMPQTERHYFWKEYLAVWLKYGAQLDLDGKLLLYI